jgi:phosphoribosylanthranilate isomerase
VFVKICGLKTQEHVDAAVAAGADAIGFVFAESVRRMDPAAAAALTQSVPKNVRKVAVMLHPSNEEWRQVLDGFEPDVLQTDADDFETLDVPASIESWPVFRENKKVADTFRLPKKVSATFLYEGAKSGQGETVDWSRAAQIAKRGNMILAGGLAPTNVAAAVQAVRPWGVDVSSGVESAPGQKDSQLIREFIRAAKAAERDL